MATVTRPLIALCAGELMSRDVIMIPAEMSLHGAARLLSRANVSGAPVVDDRGRCVGVLSASDFIHWAEAAKPNRDSDCMCSAWQLPEEDHARRTVRELMTGDPVTISIGMPIGEISRTMVDAHIHRVVVVDADRRPIGIVSSTDILAAVCESTTHEKFSTAEFTA